MREKSFILLLLIINLADCLDFDPCLLNPCPPRHICIENRESVERFRCISETPLKLSIGRIQKDLKLSEANLKKSVLATMPASTTTKSTTTTTETALTNSEGDFDACLSGPCRLGTICKSIVEEPGFICEKESLSNQANNMNTIDGNNKKAEYSSSTIVQNSTISAPTTTMQSVVETIQIMTPTAPFTLTTTTTTAKSSFYTATLPPSTTWTTKSTSQQAIARNILDRKFDVDRQKNNNEQEETEEEENEEEEDDEEEMQKNKQRDVLQTIGGMNSLNKKASELNAQIIELCNEKAEVPSRVEHPSHQDQFVVCLPDQKYTVFDCPSGLFYNKYLDRCDYNQETFSSGCASMPCQYGSKCIDMDAARGEFRCECRPGYTGLLCENAPDICDAEDRCGPNGQCHSLPWTSVIPYYCTCFDNKKFGMSCDAKASESNPCLNYYSDERRNIFSTRIDASVFVHCKLDRIELKYCANRHEISDDDIQKCKWLDISSLQIKNKNKLKSYFDTLKRK